jgi:hypothetical protein
MQRRRLLQLGLGSALALGLAGGAAVLWQPGLKGTRLTPAGRQALGALAAALLDGAWPEGAMAKAQAIEQHLTRFEETIANFPPAVRDEVQLLLSLICNQPGRAGLLGIGKPLHEVALAELQKALTGLRFSRLALRQQSYFALRDLNFAAFYAQPESWASLGYPGPTTI